MSSKLIEKRKEFEAKQKKLHDIFKEAGDDRDMDKITSLTGDSKAKVEEIQKKNKELEDLGKEIEGLVAIEEMAKADESRQKSTSEPGKKGFFPDDQGKSLNIESKSLGEMFCESPEFKGYSRGKTGVEIDIPLKTVMSTAAGFAPQSIRTGEIVPYVRRPPLVLDMMTVRPTSQAAVVYMEETTRTNNAAEHVESTGVMGEAAIAYTERSVTCQEVGTFIPVTSQQLEDVPQIQGIINDELIQMLRERMDYQILNGVGTTCYLAGIIGGSVTGVQSRSYAGDYFDTCYNALNDIRVTGRSIPSAFIFHPNDWSKVRLQRSEDGLYILGNPNETVERLWGIPVVQTDAIAEKTTLAGAFADWTKLYEKRGIVIEITDSHDTYFVYGKYAIRATVRVAVVTSRPAAFCKITR
jgi:HK97 family phage major capsid protein